MCIDNTFNVREFDVSHLEGLRALWAEQYDPNYAIRREILFKWLTERNPYLKGERPYYLLFHKDRMIGMLGHMPLEITINGRLKSFRLSHDILLSKEYRGKGIGRFLPIGALTHDDSLTGALWFNEPNHRMYEKCGWQNVPNLTSYLKIYNPISFIRQKFKTKPIAGCLSAMMRLVLSVKEALRTKDGYEDIKIQEIETFDEEYDEFYDSISHKFGIIVVRKHRYLNWKFIEKPFNNYKCYKALDEKNELSGYMVIKREAFGSRKRGKIVDILADPSQPRSFQALINRADLELSNLGADYIGVICSYPHFERELERLGFVKGRNREYFMVNNWEKDYRNVFISNVDNWYLTHSDGDGDAWQVDDQEIN